MNHHRSLPILVPDVQSQRFSCHSCTQCCREVVVHLTQQDRERLDDQGWAGRLELPPYIRLEGAWVLNQRPGEGCVFLLPDGRCRIHAEYGFDQKPLICRLYPFTLLPRGQSLQLGCRFDCPSVVSSRGTLLDRHLQDLRHAASEMRWMQPEGDAASFQKGVSTTDKEVEFLIRQLDQWLVDEAVQPRMRLLGFAFLSETFMQIRYDKVRGEPFMELVDLLLGSLQEEVKVLAVAPPTSRHKRILKQQVFAHIESISFDDAVAGRMRRFRRMISQLARGHTFTRSAGLTPRTVVSERPVGFDQIDQVTVPASDSQSIEELVIRYVRFRLASHHFYGRRYYHFPIATGLQALVSTMTVWGYLSRYFAAARGADQINHEDVTDALRHISRASGISKALGSRSARGRLYYLGLEHGLLRLMDAYPLV